MCEKMDATPKKPRFFKKLERLRSNMQNSAAKQHLQKLHEKEQFEDLKNGLIKERTWHVELKDDLTKQDFYIISMAYFCRTIDDVYIPAELGLIKYSLQSGVKQQLHMHINPGKIPVGLHYETLQHANSTHLLPIPPNALGLTDYNEIEVQLLSFLEAKEQFPLLLFTNSKDVPIVESMLGPILGNLIKKGMLYVCPLAELLQHLQNSVDVNNEEETRLTVRTAQHMLDMDFFSYTSGISCEYHESKNLLVHCALSQTIRWAYTISKVCCKHLEIELIPGKHIPEYTVDKQQLLPAMDSSEGDNIVQKQLLSVTDNSEDEAASSSDDGNDDRMSFVSYATGYTSMPPGEIQMLDENEKTTRIKLVCGDVFDARPI